MTIVVSLRDLALSRTVCTFFEAYWQEKFSNNVLPLRVGNDIATIDQAMHVFEILSSRREYTKLNPGNSQTDTGGRIILKGGYSTVTSSGSINFSTRNAGNEGVSGQIKIYSGTSSSGSSGSVMISSSNSLNGRGDYHHRLMFSHHWQHHHEFENVHRHLRRQNEDYFQFLQSYE